MPSTEWTPSVADVAAILRSRTKDTSGNELGTFTADTRPTGSQVVDIISLAVGDVVTLIGPDVDVSLQGAAASLATLGAAMKVELSFYPEQVASEHSPYRQLKEAYDGAAKNLVVAVGKVNTGDTLGDEVAGDPAYGYPEDAGGMVGWGTRW